MAHLPFPDYSLDSKLFIGKIIEIKFACHYITDTNKSNLDFKK